MLVLVIATFSGRIRWSAPELVPVASVATSAPPPASPVPEAVAMPSPAPLSPPANAIAAIETPAELSPSPPAAERPAKSSAEWEAFLLAAPEVSLLSARDASRPVVPRDAGHDQPVVAFVDVIGLIDGREDLRGLPVLRGDDCQGPAVIGDASRKLRRILSGVAAAQRKGSFTEVDACSDSQRELLAATKGQPNLIWQMCECESTAMRHMALDTLRIFDGLRVTETLTRVALFDPDPELRHAATTALFTRSPDVYRPLLLAAFAHPWEPAAEHAADALERLNDHASVPALVRLLKAPDPVAPARNAEGTFVVRELVKINHARNCQLCHAPSGDQRETARATVPSPTRPLPPPFSLEYYVSDSSGPVVRADVTYLRQDFSRVLPVKDHGPWPADQRYDFLVRTRPATADEIAAPPATKYPQRAAVLRALQRITGLKTGDNLEFWQRYVRLNYPQRG